MRVVDKAVKEVDRREDTDTRVDDLKALLRELSVDGSSYAIYSLTAYAEQRGVDLCRLPFSLRVVLENVLRHSDDESACNGIFDRTDLRSAKEVAFRFTRVLMPDSSGVPLLGDLAAMRDAIGALGGEPADLDPSVPVDIVVDHSVAVDVRGVVDSALRNHAIEMSRNAERYAFLRWGGQAFRNVRVVPPGNGICHQVNLEHLARVVWTEVIDGRTIAFPDSVIGTDSHTPMVNSLGVLGWGVGGLEGAMVALGESLSMSVPTVIGCRLTGALRPGITAMDLALTLTQEMRRHGTIGAFIEYCGPGLNALSVTDRSTVSNMAPEMGATVGFFPVDFETIRYLRSTGRNEAQVALVEAYCREQGLWRNVDGPEPGFDALIEIDLRAVEPSVAGPSRPQQRIPLSGVAAAFRESYDLAMDVDLEIPSHGAVSVAAITSCTTTSNPTMMVGAGLLARRAVEKGLRSKPWVKTSLSPGSRVVAAYLTRSGLQQYLDALGFQVTGFGCMTCMGNSGPLLPDMQTAIETRKIVAASVLSGNRNFSGRIHPAVRANFLASPPLVVAYAIAGSVLVNLADEPLGTDGGGKPVYLRDIWPGDAEVRQIVDGFLSAPSFTEAYRHFLEPFAWRSLHHRTGLTFAWQDNSHSIRCPPFFEGMRPVPDPSTEIRGARVLGIFGDMLTTDDISPVGSIPSDTPAGRYLASRGIAPDDFQTYLARRLNHDVMLRGTFAGVRLQNEMTPGHEGSHTRHHPSGEEMPFDDAASRYRREGVPLVVVAGSAYGAGSSRDWAAKGTSLFGVRAVIAESFERIHRSNLLGMGVLPLQFTTGDTRKSLRLDGSELVDLLGLGDLQPSGTVRCRIVRHDGVKLEVNLQARVDTVREVDDLRHGGTFHRIVRDRVTRHTGLCRSGVDAHLSHSSRGC